MKEIKKVVTREVKETFTGWEAIDGTFFDDKAECKKYEESAKGVLRGKLAKLIVNKKYNGWELLGGYEDNQILAIIILISLIFLEMICLPRDLKLKLR